ncbi:MAG: precorrin-2 dehydrogenase/sirohydrochlorin ferrochelatase family protein [Syntrophomonadaceae bacterium]|jgi:precorrin-2 dehydrogenase/sirohydrochlorin ferrochelatase
MQRLFPIFLNLQDKTCLLIGGGVVAERKIATLLEYGTRVRIVSKAITAQIEQWHRENRVEIALRDFCEEDLEGVFLVFAATNDSDVNRKVSQCCREKEILVNVVEHPEQGDFFVPSILRRDDLTVAISTAGKSPAFARRLRRELEAIITPAYGEFVDLLGEVRRCLQEQVPDIRRRKQILESLVYSDILDLIQVGDKDKAKEKIRQCMSFWQD